MGDQMDLDSINLDPMGLLSMELKPLIWTPLMVDALDWNQMDCGPMISDLLDL